MFTCLSYRCTITYVQIYSKNDKEITTIHIFKDARNPRFATLLLDFIIFLVDEDQIGDMMEKQPQTKI